MGTSFKDQKRRNNIAFGKSTHIYQIALWSAHLRKHEAIGFDTKPGNIVPEQGHHPKLGKYALSRQRAHPYITAGARETVAYTVPELRLLGMYARCAQVRGETRNPLLRCPHARKLHRERERAGRLAGSTRSRGRGGSGAFRRRSKSVEAKNKVFLKDRSASPGSDVTSTKGIAVTS